MLDIYIGVDSREPDAYAVAAHSCRARASGPVRIHPLCAQDLYRRHLLWRPVEQEGNRMVDHLSDAPQSTEFATSRFLVPEIQRSGWALFVDCDVVFLGDVYKVLEYADPASAVCVVKHSYRPRETVKMDGQPQTDYPRKNWSSVVLWNCDHMAHRRLGLATINYYPGEILHKFFWLRDREIGELPPRFNWLVNVIDKPADPVIAHFTLGGPWLPGWQASPHDEIWNEAKNNLRAAR